MDSPAAKKPRTEAAAAPSPKEGAAVQKKREIEEAHKNWVVAAPQIYDVCMQKHMRWPALTCDWLPGYAECGRPGWNRHRLLVGTHTSGDEPNELLVLVPRARAGRRWGVANRGAAADRPERSVDATAGPRGRGADRETTGRGGVAGRIAKRRAAATADG